MKTTNKIIWLTLALVLSACDIKEEIPYPIVYGQITEFEVEGQSDNLGGAKVPASIDKENRKIKLYVNDTVDITKIRITKIKTAGISYNPDVDYTETPKVTPDPARCADFNKFPKTDFNNPNNGQDTRVNFKYPVEFTVSTYQDYKWTVSIEQIVNREIEVENQIGNAIIDPELCNVVIYVNKEQSLKKLKVHKFSLGGESGLVSPDPTESETYDFYNMRQFVVKTGWGAIQLWQVVVYHTDEVAKTTATVFARNHTATISGNKPNGIIPKIEYKQSGESSWHHVAEKDIVANSTTYSTTLTKLTPKTKYIYRVSTEGNYNEEQEFTTVAIQELPNGNFDDWHTDASNAKLYNPWKVGSTPFWDTGNRGATTVGNSNSIPTNDTSTGNGLAAYLESKYIVIKFAAGNIFTGTYLKTDGTNGILGFGRPFSAFPNKLEFDYKYKSEEINKIGDDAYQHLMGKPDSCNIFVALWHIEENELEEFQGEKYPLIIRTKPGIEQSLFNANDSKVIAYGQFTKGDDVDIWTSASIDINYKNTMLSPTHIVVVASSSKYGDFFTGGVGSTLVIDNMKLIYE